jgi:hypothetical protein
VEAALGPGIYTENEDGVQELDVSLVRNPLDGKRLLIEDSSGIHYVIVAATLGKRAQKPNGADEGPSGGRGGRGRARKVVEDPGVPTDTSDWWTKALNQDEYAVHFVRLGDEQWPISSIFATNPAERYPRGTFLVVMDDSDSWRSRCNNQMGGQKLWVWLMGLAENLRLHSDNLVDPHGRGTATGGVEEQWKENPCNALQLCARKALSSVRGVSVVHMAEGCITWAHMLSGVQLCFFASLTGECSKPLFLKLRRRPVW